MLKIVNKLVCIFCGLCGNILEHRGNKYFKAVDKYVDSVNKIAATVIISLEIEYNTDLH